MFNKHKLKAVPVFIIIVSASKVNITLSNFCANILFIVYSVHSILFINHIFFKNNVYKNIF